MCSPNDSPAMVAAKLSRTYSTWLLTKEGDELVYNVQKFVKKINNYGAVEKSLLSKIVKNQHKGRNQQLNASSLIAIVDECYLEASTDMLFSVLCQSVAKRLGEDRLKKV